MGDGDQSVRAVVEIDGTPLPAEFEPILEQVVVDHSLHLPDAVTLTFRDLDRRIVERAKVKIGSTIKIAGTELGSQKPVPLFFGDVTGLEADYHARGARAVIRGYDASHRMGVGRWTSTYQNAKDSDLAREIAQRYKLDGGTIDDSGTVHPHVSQLNVSDWDFLRARAREIGFEVAVADGKLHFRKPKDAKEAPAAGDYNSADPLQLVFGQELLEFRPRITAAGQVSGVSVRSWDFKNKQSLVQKLDAATTSVALRDNPLALTSQFGKRQFAVVDRPYQTQAEVDKAAKALSEEIASTWAEADGVARGNPKLRAGSAVNVAVVAEAFAGRYTLTHTRHIFDVEGYRTQFTVSGRQERSLLGLTSMGMSAGPAQGGGSSKIYGLAVALVTDNNDPEGLGRVKLRFPWLADDYESYWARMVQVGAGPKSGAVFLPEVDDEVLVGFEFGDPSRPYVVGGLYNGRDKPDLGDKLFDHGKVMRRGFVSRLGHKIVFMDDKGKSGIALISASGKLKVTLDETNGEIRIRAGKVTVQADDSLDIKSGGNMTIKAGGNLTVSGTLIKLN